MWTLEAKTRILRTRSGFVRHRALAATLPYAAADEVPIIVSELLDVAERPAGPGWSAVESVLIAWQRLDSRTRLAALDSARLALPSWLLNGARFGGEQRAALTFQIAADISIALDDPASRVSAIIETPELRASIDHVLAAAAMDYPSNRISAVLEALLAVAHAPGPSVRAFMSDSTQPAHMPLRTLARRQSSSTPPRRLVSWLALPALAPIAREALESALAAGDAATLEVSHLLLVRSRSTETKRISRFDRLLDNDAAISGLSEPSRRGLVRWMGLAGIKRERTLRTLGRLVADPSALVRLDAARALSRLQPTPESDLILQDFALDQSPAVAGTAARALASAASPARRRSLEHFLETLRRSPHESVRRIVPAKREHLAPRRSEPALAGSRTGGTE